MPNHEIAVVGWGTDDDAEGDGVPYWIGRNSWGSYWGEHGFFKIRMHKNNLGIENFCSWADPRVPDNWLPAVDGGVSVAGGQQFESLMQLLKSQNSILAPAVAALKQYNTPTADYALMLLLQLHRPVVQAPAVAALQSTWGGKVQAGHKAVSTAAVSQASNNEGVHTTQEVLVVEDATALMAVERSARSCLLLRRVADWVSSLLPVSTMPLPADDQQQGELYDTLDARTADDNNGDGDDDDHNVDDDDDDEQDGQEEQEEQHDQQEEEDDNDDKDNQLIVSTQEGVTAAFTSAALTSEYGSTSGWLQAVSDVLQSAIEAMTAPQHDGDDVQSSGSDDAGPIRDVMAAAQAAVVNSGSTTGERTGRCWHASCIVVAESCERRRTQVDTSICYVCITLPEVT